MARLKAQIVKGKIKKNKWGALNTNIKKLGNI